MSNENALISIVIPAFNNPEYTQKTIDSVLLQTYRPIEIILSDDHSPQSLQGLVELKKKECDSGISIKYFWQEKNLNYYWNLQFVIDQASGKYIVLLDHDDWLIDTNYLFDAVLAMEGRADCFLSIANTFFENLPKTILQFHFQNWHYVDGSQLIKNQLFSSIHPARSAVVLRLDKLRELQYQKYFIDKNVGNTIGVMPDEAYVLICLLASSGMVALSGRVVSVRGTPPGSLSNTTFWNKSGGQKSFISHFLLYKYFREIRCVDGTQAMAHNLILRYPCKRFNSRIIKHLNYDKVAIFFMFSGNMYSLVTQIIKLPTEAVKLLKRTIVWLAKSLLIRS